MHFLSLLIVYTGLILCPASDSLVIEETATVQLTQNAERFWVDQLGQIYYLSKTKELVVLTKDGKEYSYSGNLVKEDFQLDVSNPLKPLLFNRFYNQVLFFDHQLTPIGEPVYLDDLGYYDVLACAGSSQNGFWLLDGREKQLHYYDETLQLRKSSNRLGNWVNPDENRTTYLYEWKQQLIIQQEGKNIVLAGMDDFYFVEHPLKTNERLSFYNKSIVFLQQHSIVRYHPENYEKQRIEVNIVQKNYKQGRIVQNKLYLLYGHKVIIYKLEHIKFGNGKEAKKSE